MVAGKRFGVADARRFYDRFGAKQDSQAFYEDAALDALVAHGRLGAAKAVLEVGCGTGRFAERLLRACLPGEARYAGTDVSDTMVGLARERLGPWADRAEVQRSDGGFDFSALGPAFDRVIFTYVLDLLEAEEIGLALHGAHRALGDGGLLLACGLTFGPGLPSRLTSALWTRIHRIRPALVGGCRPIVIRDHLDPARWRIVHQSVVVRAMVPSEVIVAEAI